MQRRIAGLAGCASLGKPTSPPCSSVKSSSDGPEPSAARERAAGEGGRAGPGGRGPAAVDTDLATSLADPAPPVARAGPGQLPWTGRLQLNELRGAPGHLLDPVVPPKSTETFSAR